MEDKKAFQHLTLKCLFFAPPLDGIDKNVIYSDDLLQKMTIQKSKLTYITAA
jgi:hypothetical protein